MRILFVTMESPLEPDRGVRIRDRELISRVAAEHTVSILPVLQPGQTVGEDAEFARRCRVLAPVYVDPAMGRALARLPSHLLRGDPAASLPFITRELVARVKTAVNVEHPDIVQLEHSFIAPCLRYLPAGCRRVLSLHNVAHRQYASMALAAGSRRERVSHRTKAALLRRLEISHLKLADGAVVVSELERRALHDAGAPSMPIAVVANGADCGRRSSLPADGESGTLLFVGNLAYPPNAQAVVGFCRNVLPRLRKRLPRVKLIVVGPEPPPDVAALAGPAVEVVGRVPHVQPWYARAQVVVVPLLAGGGTRLKVLEAMAFERCVVSSPVGAEGLAVRDGRELLLAEPGEAFARRVEQALTDAPLRRAVARQGRAFVMREHSWDQAAAELLALYATIESRPSRRSPRSRFSTARVVSDQAR